MFNPSIPLAFVFNLHFCSDKWRCRGSHKAKAAKHCLSSSSSSQDGPFQARETGNEKSNKINVCVNYSWVACCAVYMLFVCPRIRIWFPLWVQFTSNIQQQRLKRLKLLRCQHNERRIRVPTSLYWSILAVRHCLWLISDWKPRK